MKAALKAIKKYLGTDPRLTPYFNRLQWWWEGRSYAARNISACYRQMYQELARLCLEKQPATIMEFGCGDAYLLRQIHASRPQTKLFGCDFSKTQLREARKRLPDANFQYQDIRATTYEDKIFDVTIGISTLMYLTPQDLPKALKELGRISNTVISVETDSRYLSKKKKEELNNTADGRFDHDYQANFLSAGFKIVQSYRIECFWDPQINTLGEMGYGVIIARR